MPPPTANTSTDPRDPLALPDPLFSPRQHAVIALLAGGQSVTAAAHICGLHRTTIHYWLRNDPDFADALRDARQDRAHHWQACADPHGEAAFQLIRQMIDDETAPKSVRLKAALTIYHQVTQNPTPPDAETRRRERLIRVNYLLAAEDAAARAAAAAEEEKQQAAPEQEQKEAPQPAPAPASPTIQQNSSLFITSTPVSDSTPPHIRTSEKIGRNQPCPCGSHKKYKHCCWLTKAA